jgi:nitrite reductase (NADH) small subunit
MSAHDWKNIGPLESIPRSGSRRLCLRQAGRPIAVFRTRDDEVFALIDECPHKRGPLSEGIVSGKTVTCPLHNWGIALDSGEAMAPDEGRAGSIPLRVVDGNIHVYLPEPAVEAIA